MSTSKAVCEKGIERMVPSAYPDAGVTLAEAGEWGIENV